MNGDDAEFNQLTLVQSGIVDAEVNHTYSMTGLVPSATVSKPWGVAITGSACSRDAERVGEAWLND
jgi:hypothetical protein